MKRFGLASARLQPRQRPIDQRDRYRDREIERERDLNVTIAVSAQYINIYTKNSIRQNSRLHSSLEQQSIDKYEKQK